LEDFPVFLEDSPFLLEELGKIGDLGGNVEFSEKVGDLKLLILSRSQQKKHQLLFLHQDDIIDLIKLFL